MTEFVRVHVPRLHRRQGVQLEGFHAFVSPRQKVTVSFTTVRSRRARTTAKIYEIRLFSKPAFFAACSCQILIQNFSSNHRTWSLWIEPWLTVAPQWRMVIDGVVCFRRLIEEKRWCLLRLRILSLW